MEEKHICNFSKTDDDYLKSLELVAKGSYSERAIKTMFIALIVLFSIFIICISVVAVYGINRYHNYLMNTEVVERVEVVEEIIQNADRDGENYKANGNIIQNSNFDNSSIGGNYGRDKQK